jgi:hypothetical protein
LPTRHFDVLIVGGGAAGFFAAANLKLINPKINVGILEGSSKVLSKVAISGGGRCNVTHNAASIAELSKAYPRGKSFLKKAFKQFWVPDLIKWFKVQKVDLKYEEDGRMFPVSNTSETIVNCFKNLIDDSDVQVLYNSKVLKIEKNIQGFYLETKNGNFNCNQLLVASGGHQKLIQYQYLDSFNLEISPPSPSLFTFNLPGQSITNLTGLSVNQVKVVVPSLKKENVGPLLITHWGMSGPAVLVLSSLCAMEMQACQYNFEFYVDWLPAHDYTDITFSSRKKVLNTRPSEIPKRLWEYLLKRVRIDPEKNADQLSKTELNRLKEILKHDIYQTSGKTTFKEEFVTCGGVDLNQIDHKTMQCKTHDHLYFAGEVLNIDAITGGYNFQAAWTTAYISAKNIALQYEN